VRVMTVHGAKGLEANTVILADTTTKPTGPRDPKLLPLPEEHLIWATTKKEDVGAMSDAREQSQVEARDEYRRLFYVAMTRAKEKLIVCGTQGVQKIPDGCWYELVRTALCSGEPDEVADDGDGNVWRFRTAPDAPKAAMPAVEKPTKKTRAPEWLTQDVAPDPDTVRTLRPSSAGEDEQVRAVTAGDRRTALKRGSLVHRLMQSLPDIPPDRRAKATEEFLKRAGAEFVAKDRRTIAEQVQCLFENAQFLPLFAPGSRAEVPVVGTLTQGGKTFRIAGQIDRLVVTQDFVLIGDFKTNRPAPRRIADVPEAYVTQLALYRAVLTKLYPGKVIRAALIWTEVPDLMELSTEVLNAALVKVISA
jgi:ATP-dependent helicase/nuclease subunit A